MSDPDKDLWSTSDSELEADEKTLSQTSGMFEERNALQPPTRKVNWEKQTLNRILAGRYRVEQTIGEGGMGRVYRGYDIDLQRPVAIKTIHADKALRRNWLRRFRMEAQIVATLRHPNIVQIYEVIARGRLPFFIMEYVDGIGYDEIIQYDDITHQEHIAYFITICEAIGYAHGRGVIHRDIKPSNVMITDEGQPKIMDFGVAKVLDDEKINTMESMHTMVGTILGSPAFMSPEQARGDHPNLDIRSDIYSLGAMFYFALTKKLPFKGPSVAEVITQVIKTDVTPPSIFTKGLAPDLEGICLKAMAKKREDRYQNAFEFAKDLSSFRDGLPVSARRYGLKEKIVRAIRRKKETFIMSLLAIFIMFAGICYTLSLIHRVSRESLMQELREKITAVAATSSLLIDPTSVLLIRNPEDKDKAVCRELVKRLKEIKNTNENITFVWIMRRSQKRAGYSEFIVEDSFYDSFEELDDNQNSVLDEGENPVEIGEIYQESLNFPDLEIGYQKPTADRVILEDKWGVSLSGYAPIQDAQGRSIAVLGVDMTTEQVGKTFLRLSHAYNWTLILSVLGSLGLVVLLILWIIGLWENKQS